MKKYLLLILIIAVINTDVFSQIKKVAAIGFTVSDMDRSVKFYSDVLRFQKISDNEYFGEQWEELLGIFGVRVRVVRMQLGEEQIELMDFLTAGGRTIPDDFKSNDLAFQHIAIVVSDMDSAYAVLRKSNVQHVSTAPQTLPASIPEAEGIKAFYFQDPDKHNLEVIYFPKGKGQAKWQTNKKQIFLGIDHTAIAVSDSRQSHLFYQDKIGIDRKGDSWNHGTEQAHLNNVQGASLHITGYRATAGPGVEFLEYLFPGPGRKYPTDSRPNDIWHWYTVMDVNNAEQLVRSLSFDKYQVVGGVRTPMTISGKSISKVFLVRDPDGHAILVQE